MGPIRKTGCIVCPQWVDVVVLGVNAAHCSQQLGMVLPTLPGNVGESLPVVRAGDSPSQATGCSRSSLLSFCALLSLRRGLQLLAHQVCAPQRALQSRSGPLQVIYSFLLSQQHQIVNTGDADTQSLISCCLCPPEVCWERQQVHTANPFFREQCFVPVVDVVGMGRWLD